MDKIKRGKGAFKVMDTKTLEFRLSVKDSVLGLGTSVKKIADKLLLLKGQHEKNRKNYYLRCFNTSSSTLQIAYRDVKPMHIVESFFCISWKLIMH